jgi:chromosomal replication initiation ATPase DnaA
MNTEEQEDELYLTIGKARKVYGTQGVMSILKTAIKYTTEEKENIEFILQKSCTYFSISYRNLRHGFSRGDRRDARDVCWYLLKKHAKLSLKQISDIFAGNDGVGNISRAIGKVKNLDKKSKVDAVLLEKIKLIEKDFLNKK